MENWVLPVAISGIIVIAGVWYLLGRKKTDIRTLVNPQQTVAVRLVKKDKVSPDTRRFRFSLPSPQHTLGLPLGKHIYLSATVGGIPVSRPYTPTSLRDQKGYFELVIKVYFAGVHPKFPDGGKMSQYLEQLDINDTISVKGPRGKMTYRGGGVLAVTDAIGRNERVVQVSQIGMIAGGTGITPMYQIIQAIFLDENDTTKINLLFANQTEEDILIREELEQFSRRFPDRFKLWYTLDRPGDDWIYSKGFINEEMVRERLPAPGDETLILICGPPPMVEYACRPNLEKVGFNLSTQVFTF